MTETLARRRGSRSEHDSEAVEPESPPAPERRRRSFTLIAALLVAGLLVSATVAIVIGPVAIPATQAWRIAAHHLLPGSVTPDWPVSLDQIVWQVRLPRVVLALLVGAGLSVVGTAMQALVRNPLADPYVFGITSGASVGAVGVILLGISVFGIYSLSLSAFLGALLSLVLVFTMAQRRGGIEPLRLVLAGVAVSYMLSAVTSYMVFQAGPEKTRSVVFWLLGGLGAARWSFLTLPAIVVSLGLGYLLLHGRTLNALLLGDESAASLGVDLQSFRRRLFGLSALLTGALVAVSGGIGFVGLMIPHVCRLLVGADHRRVLPLAALLGALFLIWADVAARTVVAPAELPIGIITALVGGPFFLWLLRQRKTTRPGGAAS